jgi:UDP-GlcNAc:undecaprenyl-phosphate GlcNAc-1-phosphate transferase
MRSPARQIEVRLQGSADWKELWNAITASAVELNLCQVRLDVNAPSLHEGYHARWDSGQEEGEVPHLWRAEIQLKVRGLAVGRLEVVGQPDDEPMWVKIAALTKALEGVADALPPLAAPRREVSVRVADWQLVSVNAEA